VDCGLYQGLKALRLRNWDKLPVDPARIDAVALTHAHIDHIGYLPRLFKDGFGGPVTATRGTEDLARILLEFRREVAVPYAPAFLVRAALTPLAWLGRRRIMVPKATRQHESG
jgi:Cft2 family RNA processing exonuclease